jgi:hypothetical protein
MNDKWYPVVGGLGAMKKPYDLAICEPEWPCSCVIHLHCDKCVRPEDINDFELYAQDYIDNLKAVSDFQNDMKYHINQRKARHMKMAMVMADWMATHAGQAGMYHWILVKTKQRRINNDSA